MKDFAYATLRQYSQPYNPRQKPDWEAIPMGRQDGRGWIIRNPLDIPVEQEGAVVMIRYSVYDRECAVVTPFDVEIWYSERGNL